MLSVALLTQVLSGALGLSGSLIIFLKNSVFIHHFPYLDFLFLYFVYIFAGEFLLWKHWMYL